MFWGLIPLVRKYASRGGIPIGLLLYKSVRKRFFSFMLTLAFIIPFGLPYLSILFPSPFLPASPSTFLPVSFLEGEGVGGAE